MARADHRSPAVGHDPRSFLLGLSLRLRSPAAGRLSRSRARCKPPPGPDGLASIARAKGPGDPGRHAGLGRACRHATLRSSVGRALHHPVPRRQRVRGHRLHARQRQQPREALSHRATARAWRCSTTTATAWLDLYFATTRNFPLDAPDDVAGEQALSQPRRRHVRGRHRARGRRLPRVLPRRGGRRRRQQRLPRPLPVQLRPQRALPQPGRRHVPRREGLRGGVPLLVDLGGVPRLRQRRLARPLRLLLRPLGLRRAASVLRRRGQAVRIYCPPVDDPSRSPLPLPEPRRRHVRGRHRARRRAPSRRPRHGRRRRRRQPRRADRHLRRQRHVPAFPLPQPGRRHVRGRHRTPPGPRSPSRATTRGAWASTSRTSTATAFPSCSSPISTASTTRSTRRPTAGTSRT